MRYSSAEVLGKNTRSGLYHVLIGVNGNGNEGLFLKYYIWYLVALWLKCPWYKAVAGIILLLIS